MLVMGMMNTHVQIYYTDHNALKVCPQSGNVIKKGRWLISELTPKGSISRGLGNSEHFRVVLTEER